MKLQLIDIIVIITYIVITLLIGFWISKKAKSNLDSYFLGGKSMPWYLLGLSNASGMFDIAGTMLLVTWGFVYGLKGVWLPWLWPVWNQIFLMIFLAVWLRRSNVLTGAEWLKTRFGEGMGARLSHISVVVFALIAVIGFIAYAFEGIGKFATSFLPWDMSLQIGEFLVSSERVYALLIMGITTLYIIKGGMYSVVLTEVMQFIIMTISAIAIGVIAMNVVSYEQLNAVIPDGWKNLFFGWNLDIDWSNITPEVNDKIQKDGFSLFGALMMMMVFRGIFVSIAGPVPGYDMQRVLATKSPKEAALMSGSVSLVLYFPRYLMVTGLTVIGLVYFNKEALMTADGLDFEKLLPYALSNFVPAGLLGLILAGLIAAFMSTFAANVNAGPAYIVNDIYKRFINPNASDKQLIKMSYISSFAVVALGIFVGFFVESINSILLWITGALFGGYAVANVLKWIWWRFNGYGFFWGMILGIIPSLILPQVCADCSVLITFPIVFTCSLLGSVFGSILTKQDTDETLMSFYKTVKPWGFWKPIIKKIKAENPEFRHNTFFLRDMFNSFIGIVWQMTLVVMPIYLVIKEFKYFLIGVIIFIITSLILKVNWFNKLED